eukprot:jgi/Orpsp1_1/1189404/evm.model.d7180000071813.1
MNPNENKKKKKQYYENTDDIFQADERVTENRFHNNNFFCQKYWYRPFYTNFTYDILPGRHEHVSGSTLGGFNLAINKYIDNEHREAALKVFNFITSLETQKMIVQKYKYFSAIPSLYYDEDVCNTPNVNCNAFKNIQLVERPTESVGDYTAYSTRFRNHIYSSLFGDESSKDALKKANDVSKLHMITMDTQESYIGLIVVISVTVLSIIMLLSSFFLYKRKFAPYLKLLTNDFWIITIIGACIMMHSLYAEIGEINVIKCHIKPIALILGFTLSFIPIFHRLIVNFPKKNRISYWAYHHPYTFLLIVLAIDTVFYELYLFAPYNVHLTTSVDGKMYNICRSNNIFTKVILYSMVIIRAILLFIAIGLIFVEWHLQETITDLKYLLASIITDAICCIILFVMTNSEIQSNDFLTYYTVFSVVVIIFALSHYLFSYGIKLLIFVFRNCKTFNTPLELQDSFKNSNPLTGATIGTLGNGSSQSHSYHNYTNIIDYSNYDFFANKKISYDEKEGGFYQTIINLHNKGSNQDICYDTNNLYYIK